MVTAYAPGNRAMFFEAGLGVAMAFEAKPMKPGLDAQLEIGAAAAVAADAGVHAAPIGKVVMTNQAVDGDMFCMRKIEHQALRAGHQWLAKRRSGRPADQSAEADREEGGHDQYQAIVAAEDELTARAFCGRGDREAGGGPACPQQHENAADGCGEHP